MLTLGPLLGWAGSWHSQVLAGNVAESGTMAGILHALQAAPETVVVLDKVIGTEANVAWLREKGYRYLVASRVRQVEVDLDKAIALGTGV